MTILRRFVQQREISLLVFIVTIGVLMALTNPVFLAPGNVSGMLLALSIDGILAVGMTILLVSGGFDLSIGSAVAFAGALAAILLSAGVPAVLVIMVVIGAGILIGSTYAVLIGRVGLNPFVTTLAGLSILRGLTFVVTDGNNQVVTDPLFLAIGQGNFMGVPAPILYMFVAVIVGDILLRRNRFFRRNYFIGGNEKSARLSGIPVVRTRAFNYVLMATLAAIAGVILSGRVGAATLTAGTGLELRVIAAVVIGGASLAGGEGSVLGSFLGALLLVMINNVLTLLGVSIYWQVFTIGAVLLLAVLFDRLGVVVRERSIRDQRAARLDGRPDPAAGEGETPG